MAVDEDALGQALRAMAHLIDRPPHGTATSISERVQQVMNGAVDVLGVDSIGLMLNDIADRPRVAGAIDGLASTLESAQVELGAGPGFDSMRTGRSVAVSDLAAAPEHAGLWALVEGSGIGAVLSAPLSVEGEPVGNLNAINRGRHRWTPEEIAAIEAYANALSVLLQIGARAKRAVADGHLGHLPPLRHVTEAADIDDGTRPP